MADENYPEGFLYAEKGKIAKVGTMDSLSEEIRKENKKRKEPIIDAEGGWVMPGLIDAHCHVGITEEKWGLAGEDCNETTNPITPYIREFALAFFSTSCIINLIEPTMPLVFHVQPGGTFYL